MRDNITDLAFQAEFEPTIDEAERDIDWGLDGASVMLASDLITAWNKAQSGLKLFSASASAASKHMVRQHWGSLSTETKHLRVKASSREKKAYTAASVFSIIDFACERWAAEVTLGGQLEMYTALSNMCQGRTVLRLASICSVRGRNG